MAFGKECIERVAQVELVAQREFDVQALDAVGVFAHAWQGNHDVFVDLESIGVATDSRRAFAIEPEFLARFGADGDKAFATARVGQTHDLRGSTRHVVCVVASDVADQDHLGQATALAFGGVSHGLEITVVEMLQARQQGVGALLFGEHKVFDVHNARHCIFRVAKKLQADCACVLRHAVHDPACAGDQAIASFFLDARQTT